jgi:hypothetical protein
MTRITPVCDKDDSPGQVFDLIRTGVDSDEKPDVEVYREGQKRRDVSTIASRCLSERVEHQPQCDLVTILRIDACASVVRESGRIVRLQSTR